MADSDGREGNFFGRWSQRKVQVRHGALPAEAPARPTEPVRPAAEVAQTPVGQPLSVTGVGLQPEALTQPPPPTLDDVARLTADSDYSAFAARTVDSKVRNAAMRKLFAGDPHFNVMDGLDVYIDDYSVGEAIPMSMLRQMVQARSLGLLDDELVDQDKPPLAELPTELAANNTATPHENTDLQLQRDDAAGHSGVADGAEPAEEFQAARNPGFDTQPGAGALDRRLD